MRFTGNGTSSEQEESAHEMEERNSMEKENYTG